MSRLGAWMRADPSLKITSLVLAVFLWMYVRTEEKPVQVISVPLEYQALPDHLAIGSDALDSVEVRVRAPETTIRHLSPRRFQARLSLEGAAPGEVTIPLSADNVRSPAGVEVLEVSPPSVTLRLERRLTREVPLVARFKGRPAPGYEQDGYTLVPDKVIVEGPEGIVRQVRQGVTDEVDLSGRSASFETVVGLAPDRGGVRILKDSGAVLRVSIREQRVTRIFPGVRLWPNLPEGVDYRVRFEPETVTVVLEGTQEDLDRVGLEHLRALLDLEGMGPREASYAVKPRVVIAPADLGAGVSVHSISESTVNVTIARPDR